MGRHCQSTENLPICNLHVLSHRGAGALQDQSALLQRFFEHAPMPAQGWRVLRGASGSNVKPDGIAGEH